MYLLFEILHKTKIILMLRLCFLLCHVCQLIARVARERVRGWKSKVKVKVCFIVSLLSEGQSSMVHGAKERRGERRERVELPDSLMYEAVLQSAGPRLETPQSPP